MHNHLWTLIKSGIRFKIYFIKRNFKKYISPLNILLVKYKKNALRDNVVKYSNDERSVGQLPMASGGKAVYLYKMTDVELGDCQIMCQLRKVVVLWCRGKY